MTTILTQGYSAENPLAQGMQKLFSEYPLPLNQSGQISLPDASRWLQQIMQNQEAASNLGFAPGIRYDQEHLDILETLLRQIVESDEYKNSGIIPVQCIRTWQEKQGGILIEQLGRSIEPIAGEVLTNIHNTRTRIGDLSEKPGLSSASKGLIAAGSFGIMGSFQYRLFESFFQALAQHDITQGKTGPIVQLVHNHSAMLGTGIGWSVLAACGFAYCVKEGFETHLSDKLHGTKQTRKKITCAVFGLAILLAEMTGSFSRITIGTDLKEQVIDMKNGVAKATQGSNTVFATLDDKAEKLAKIYENEGRLLYEAEAGRGGIGPYAEAKNAVRVPLSQIDLSKVERIPGLRQKVERFYEQLELQRKKMRDVQNKNGIVVTTSQNETSAPVVLSAAGYHVSRVADSLNDLSKEAVDSLLTSHNLIDPSISDIIMDLVFDAGKKLHPSDVNKLREVLNRQVDKSSKNVDELTDEFSKTIDIIDAFMRDMTDAANAQYKSQTNYTPKDKPPRIDTSELKKALNTTKVPVSVLEPWNVWPKFIKLSRDGTIPLGYSLALILRVLLVEGILLLMGYARVKKTTRALSTPGARFEDLSRETDGQYLRIIDKIERLTGSDAWKTVNGKALTREEIHTLVSSALAAQKGQSGLGNHMTVVNMDGKKITSQWQEFRDLLSASFFGQYSAPEIRRLHALDKSLVSWKKDITGEDSEVPNMTNPLLSRLREMSAKVRFKRQAPKEEGEEESTVDFATLTPRTITTIDGQHRVRNAILDTLNKPGALKLISDATAKRNAGENTSVKKHQWESAKRSIVDYIKENSHLDLIVAEIRRNQNHPLFTHVQMLDQTGDILGFYALELKEVESEMSRIMAGRDEKTLYKQGEQFIRKIGTELREKLHKLSTSGIVGKPQDKSVLEELLRISSANELLTEDNYSAITYIFTQYSGDNWVSSRVLGPNWQNKPEHNYQVFVGKLREIESEVSNFRGLQARKRKIQKYIAVSPENVTELNIMSVRNASASIKKYLEAQNQ